MRFLRSLFSLNKFSHVSVAVFHELGDVQEQNPFGQ
jgi:hypothetical protein